MPELDPKIAELEARLDSLVRTQIGFQQEIGTIRRELSKLRTASTEVPPPVVTNKLIVDPSVDASPAWPRAESYRPPPPIVRENIPSTRPVTVPSVTREMPRTTYRGSAESAERSEVPSWDSQLADRISAFVDSIRGNVESFVGKSLIPLIGIIILILGVGIGAKYAIDNGWISPLMRIVFGYAVGAALIGTAAKLKSRYHSFSAVLLSGGMAILYFVTYFAYAYYGLMPQMAAFALMAIFTVFTVSSALLYQRQVIAHIGLVGAYGVPFLLSDNSGNYLFLFAYMAIINGGILALAVKKRWKPIFYTSFGFTWIIFFGWLASKYAPDQHFTLALTFNGIFFLTFFAMKIAHSFIYEEREDRETIVSIIATTVVFFSSSAAIIANASAVQYTALFIYLAIADIAILLTALRLSRFTRMGLFYSTSIMTWAIFFGWLVWHPGEDQQFTLALLFSGVYFVTFYGIRLAYSHLFAEKDAPETALSIVYTTIMFNLAGAVISAGMAIGHGPTFFIYLAAFSISILLTAFRLSVVTWNGLFYTISVFTWATFYYWIARSHAADEHLYLVLAFLGSFFAVFYGLKILYTLVHPETDDREKLAAIVGTTVIFYLFCLGFSDVERGLEQYTVLFSFIAAFSLAILLTSFRYYGRALVYVSYPFTWIIFGVWFRGHYQAGEHFVLAAIFASVFFVVHYGATLIYRLVTDDIGMAENTAMLLTNSFVFYGFGYAIIDSREALRADEGLFTALHAIFHSLVAQTVSRLKTSATDVIQVLVILIVTFATIAVPVQLDGNNITLVWSVEAVALFWFGRARSVRLFEYMSYPIMVLATGSLFSDWVNAIGAGSSFDRQPLANGNFVTAIVFVAAFFCIYWVNRRKDFGSAIPDDLVRPFGLIIGTVGLFVLYNTFRIEIGNYFHLQFSDAGGLKGSSGSFNDISRLNFIWQLNYTLGFLAGLAAINLRRIESEIVAMATVVLSSLAILTFLSAGINAFYELRISYMNPSSEGFGVLMNVAVRYLSYIFLAASLSGINLNVRSGLLKDRLPAGIREFGWDALCYLTVLITASYELLNLMIQFSLPDGSKFGLSILWGVFALMLIGFGIAWSKKHLRISAMVLLAATLVKLFLYDVSELPTIPKTILFVSLGLLLLIVAFLYNKYASVILKRVRVENID